MTFEVCQCYVARESRFSLWKAITPSRRAKQFRCCAAGLESLNTFLPRLWEALARQSPCLCVSAPESPHGAQLPPCRVKILEKGKWQSIRFPACAEAGGKGENPAPLSSCSERRPRPWILPPPSQEPAAPQREPPCLAL